MENYEDGEIKKDIENYIIIFGWDWMKHSISVVVITSYLPAEGPGFESRIEYFFRKFNLNDV